MIAVVFLPIVGHHPYQMNVIEEIGPPAGRWITRADSGQREFKCACGLEISGPRRWVEPLAQQHIRAAEAAQALVPST